MRLLSSIILPFHQTNEPRKPPYAVTEFPTTRPRLLMATAVVLPPSIVPRSCIVEPLYRNACFKPSEPGE